MMPIMKRRHVLLAGLTVLSGLATTGKSARAADAVPTIGIIGAGHVASTLGGLWIKAGYRVMFSAQNIRNAQELAASLGPNASAALPKRPPDLEWSCCLLSLIAPSRTSDKN